VLKVKLMLDAQDLKVLKARHTSDAQELRVNEVEEAEELDHLELLRKALLVRTVMRLTTKGNSLLKLKERVTVIPAKPENKTTHMTERMALAEAEAKQRVDMVNITGVPLRKRSRHPSPKENRPPLEILKMLPLTSRLKKP
jgi:hypothetical protein